MKIVFHIETLIERFFFLKVILQNNRIYAASSRTFTPLTDESTRTIWSNFNCWWTHQTL